MTPARVLRLVLSVMILFACGCSSKNKGKIEGTKWTSQASTVKGLPVPAGFLQLDFGADKSLTYRIGPQTLSGTYSLGAGDTVTLRLSQELAGRKDHVEKVSISGDRLTMTDSDGAQMTFDKVK